MSWQLCLHEIKKQTMGWPDCSNQFLWYLATRSVPIKQKSEQTARPHDQIQHVDGHFKEALGGRNGKKKAVLLNLKAELETCVVGINK